MAFGSGIQLNLAKVKECLATCERLVVRFEEKPPHNHADWNAFSKVFLNGPCEQRDPFCLDPFCLLRGIIRQCKETLRRIKPCFSAYSVVWRELKQLKM